jgi:HPt (histidine-containing phosphotransfer) domain-containing protein
LGNDEAMLRSVLAEFLANARENVRDIRTALAARDLSALLSAAHKLKGGAMSVGARGLQQLAARLEAAARPGDWSACEDILVPLARELERVGEDIGV